MSLKNSFVDTASEILKVFVSLTNSAKDRIVIIQSCKKRFIQNSNLWLIIWSIYFPLHYALMYKFIITLNQFSLQKNDFWNKKLKVSSQ